MGNGFLEEDEREEVKLGPSDNTSHMVRMDPHSRSAQEDASDRVCGTCMKHVSAKRKRWKLLTGIEPTMNKPLMIHVETP